MALFGRKSAATTSGTDAIEADPQAYAAVPPPAPYKTAVYGPAPIAPGRTDIEKSWPNRVGDEEYLSPVVRRRYAADTEYLRDLSTPEVDGIGFHPVIDRTKAEQVPDPRWASVDPTLGHSAPRVPEHYEYSRPYDVGIARRWGVPIARDEEGVTPGYARQGNMGIREWRVTSRQDPTSGETYDRTGVSNRAVIKEYNATSTVRRDLRL